MTACKTDEAREFYLRLCIANRYTKRELDRQIGSMLYERTMISHEKHKVKELTIQVKRDLTDEEYTKLYYEVV